MSGGDQWHKTDSAQLHFITIEIAAVVVVESQTMRVVQRNLAVGFGKKKNILVFNHHRIGDASHHGRDALGKNALLIVLPVLLRMVFLRLFFCHITGRLEN